jgi:hypothetical protein
MIRMHQAVANHLCHCFSSVLNVFIMTIITGRALNWAITATAGSGFLLFGYGR